MTRKFVHLSVFDKRWAELGLDDDDLSRLQNELLKDPQKGDVVQGTGGLRKMRFAVKDKGERGGARVCYVDFVVHERIYLITAYPKSHKEYLCPYECVYIAKLIDELERECAVDLIKE